MLIDRFTAIDSFASHTVLQVTEGVPLQFSGDFLYLAVVFFVLAIVAGIVGSRGVAGLSMEIARIFIILFIILAVISLLL